jgi:hypothetical protein
VYSFLLLGHGYLCTRKDKPGQDWNLAPGSDPQNMATISVDPIAPISRSTTASACAVWPGSHLKRSEALAGPGRTRWGSWMSVVSRS